MKKIFYISFVIMFIFLILLVINSSRELYSINEESSPIREGDSIIGMDGQSYGRKESKKA